MEKPSLFFPVSMTVIALLFWLNTYLNHVGGLIAVGVSLAAVAQWVAEWRFRRHYHKRDNGAA